MLRWNILCCEILRQTLFVLKILRRWKFCALNYREDKSFLCSKILRRQRKLIPESDTYVNLTYYESVITSDENMQKMMTTMTMMMKATSREQSGQDCMIIWGQGMSIVLQEALSVWKEMRLPVFTTIWSHYIFSWFYSWLLLKC
jgi:hypothetical protein